MTALVAIIAFIAGLVVGAAVVAAYLRRPTVEVVQAPPPTRPAPAPPPVPAVAEPDSDPDLKPVLDATRGVLTELEQRYQGARAESEKPKRRAPKSRP